MFGLLSFHPQMAFLHNIGINLRDSLRNIYMPPHNPLILSKNFYLQIGKPTVSTVCLWTGAILSALHHLVYTIAYTVSEM
jgi:hypothetical protein